MKEESSAIAIQELRQQLGVVNTALQEIQAAISRMESLVALQESNTPLADAEINRRFSVAVDKARMIAGEAGITDAVIAEEIEAMRKGQ